VIIHLFVACTFLIGLCPAFSHAEVMCWDRGGLHQYCKQVVKDKKWRHTAEGWRRRDQVEIISVSFTCHDRVDVNNARRIFVPEVEKAVAMTNAKQMTKTRMKIGRPFTHKDLCYALFFKDNNQKAYPEPYIDYMMLVFGNIVYMTQTREVLEEPFEEALRIVEEESIACPNELSSYYDGTP
jgi:hypothetical protein